MRVLQVMSGAKVGGAETFFVDLASALHRAGLQQQVIIRRNAERAESLRKAGLEPIELPFGRIFDFSTRWKLKHCIEAFRPDIVQTWMSRASAACPAGSFIHVGWLGGYYDRKHFRHCDELVAVTQDLVEYAVGKGWPRQRVHYLPTLASDTPLPRLRREDFDTPDNVPLILALGRLHEEKGFDVLLNSLIAVPNAYLWLAGSGPAENQLKALTKTLGLESRVRFLGWRDDRAALYASCDLCVMPSRAEPFGTVMIEAWAYRRPIIAAAAIGPRALIKHEQNGLLVPIDDAPSLTAAIRQILEQPGLARSLADAGRAAYDADYTEAKTVSRYLAFYDSLLKTHGGHKNYK
jgi:glycosyltransferase involved in cell wall biosynthesis